MNEESLFAAAIKLESDHEIAEYLDQACSSDLAMRGRLEALIRSHKEASGLLNPRVIETAEMQSSIESEGSTIGPYKLLQKIGEGGFGVVYMAEQKQPIRRKVALKIIKLGMDTRQVIARFEAERQALAIMDHPNIARVLDAGSTEAGRPYFVMELVRGDPITEYCDSQRVTTAERLRLFVDVCHAVQHAHQKGIIHRDIKPTNVMVTMHDGRAVPKVIDFGIAKATQHELTEKTLFTEYRQFIGTPAYMSPEQAEMSGLGVDTRSDIYSLGVLLYELLTGTTPFEADQLRRAAFDEIVRLIRETEPPKPSLRLHTLSSAADASQHTAAGQSSLESQELSSGESSIQDIARSRHTDPQSLTNSVRGDLDWIVMKALEKDRGRRYETAKEMAEDIGRHLHNEPVAASPPSVTYRLHKYVRRNRSFVIAGTVVTASLLMGLILSVAGFFQAARQRDRAIEAERQALIARDDATRQRDVATDERDRAMRAETLAAQRGEQASRKHEEAEAVIDLLSELIGSANPEDLKGPNYTVRQSLDDFSKKLDKRLIEQPEVEATIQLMISDVYRQFHQFDRGLTHATRAHQLRKELYGDEHELTIRALSAKGLHLLFSQSPSTRDESQRIFDKIRELDPPLMHEDDEFAIRTKNAMTILLPRAEALTGWRALLDESKSKLGSGHPTTSMVRNNYAGRLQYSDKLEEAEQLIRLSVKHQEAYGGSDDPVASQYRVTLALVLKKRGDDDAAKQILTEELALQRKQLGHIHRITFRTLGLLLDVLYRQDHTEASNDLFADYVDAMKRENAEPSLFNLRWLLATVNDRKNLASRPRNDLLKLAALIYLDWSKQADADAIASARGFGTSLAARLLFSGQSDLAEQVTQATWTPDGSVDATDPRRNNGTVEETESKDLSSD